MDTVVSQESTPSTAPVPSATSGAASGPEHVTVPTHYDAILLAGFGGPEGQDDVIPFLRNVTRGKGIPDERLEEVAHHYRHFGGVSPINDQNRALKAALDAELARRNIDLPVYWGNRNWDPYLKDALVAAHSNGHDTLLAIATSAYSSFSSCRQYREDFASALDAANLTDTVRIDKVRQFFDHRGFIEPFIEGVRAGLTSLLTDIPDLALESEVEILFSTHSIPTADAQLSGPATREFGPGGAYEDQHLAVCRVIMASIQAEFPTAHPISWQLVYQSRSGPASQPWLEPDINDAIETLPAKGTRAVLIVPVGFVSDHMEVMWDLDTEAIETAEKHGLTAIRTQTPGTHPAYVAGLVDLVLERVNGTPVADRSSLTELGPWYDVCRPGCCENRRLGFKPAVAGVAP
ncbi:ferrochelatase [Klugiella xanthotipulae]|nr:ferrochelatase [Klugiella xanthotipulae]